MESGVKTPESGTSTLKNDSIYEVGEAQGMVCPMKKKGKSYVHG